MAPTRIPDLNVEGETHYKLHSGPDDRVQYGVDHESYAYQLALDMGSAPGLIDIWKIARQRKFSFSCPLLTIWAFGAHFNTKFRLIGPWAWEEAKDVLVTDEFWHTITRRPFLFSKSRLIFEVSSANSTGQFLVSILSMIVCGPLILVFITFSTWFEYWKD